MSAVDPPADRDEVAVVPCDPIPSPCGSNRHPEGIELTQESNLLGSGRVVFHGDDLFERRVIALLQRRVDCVDGCVKRFAAARNRVIAQRHRKRLLGSDRIRNVRLK